MSLFHRTPIIPVPSLQYQPYRSALDGCQHQAPKPRRSKLASGIEIDY